MTTTTSPTVSEDVLNVVSEQLIYAERGVADIAEEIAQLEGKLQRARARHVEASAKAVNLRQFLKQHSATQKPAYLLEA